MLNAFAAWKNGIMMDKNSTDLNSLVTIRPLDNVVSLFTRPNIKLNSIFKKE
jgi:hypothetical protein